MTTFNDWLTKFTSLLLKIVGEESNDQLASLLIEPLNIITTTHTGTYLITYQRHVFKRRKFMLSKNIFAKIKLAYNTIIRLAFLLKHIF